jgi:hypothetical protein
MGEILGKLRGLMTQRARFRANIRADRSCITSSGLQIYDALEDKLLDLRKKLSLEKRMSEAVNGIQTCYRDFNHTCQATLETYSDVRGTGFHTIAPADLEDAIEALNYLGERAVQFRTAVRSLLHTVFLPDRKAWKYITSPVLPRPPQRSHVK